MDSLEIVWKRFRMKSLRSESAKYDRLATDLEIRAKEFRVIAGERRLEANNVEASLCLLELSSL